MKFSRIGKHTIRCVDLLMAALLMAQKQGNGQAGIVGNQPAGGRGGVKVVLGEDALVCGTELNHQFFLFIMGQKRNEIRFFFLHKTP